MTEETARQLIEAMNRLAAAIQGLTGGASLVPGINVYHHHSGFPQIQTLRPNAGPYPSTIGGGYQNGNLG